MKYIVKNCPAYNPYLLECVCEDMPSILCWNNTKHCPIRKLIELYDHNKEINAVFDIAEIEDNNSSKNDVNEQDDNWEEDYNKNYPYEVRLIDVTLDTVIDTWRCSEKQNAIRIVNALKEKHKNDKNIQVTIELYGE